MRDRAALSAWRLALGALFVHAAATAAPCCGGGAALPSLITGDDRWQASLTSSMGTVIGDAPARGLPVFRAADDDEVTQTWNLRASALLSDRWQLGVGLPLVQHARNGAESGYGLGDVSATVGFEALPEWSYSAWRPKVFVYTQVTLPSGRSVYDQAPMARGRGFYQAACGVAALKTYRRWDFSLQANLAKSFRRRVGGADSYTITPTLGGLAALALGYSPGGGDVRLGLSAGPVIEGPMRIRSGAGDSRTAAQVAWNAGFSAAWMFNERWTADLSYQDQTLLGPATNVALSRSVGLGVLYRWER